MEELDKWANDEAFKATEMAEFAKTFTESDANGDGVLNRDEYIVCIKASEARAIAKGCWAMCDDEYTGRFYAAANMITPGTDGVSMADMGQAIGVVGAKSQELKEAAGL